MGTYNRIKEVRTKKHISQAELASMLDTSQSALAAYENGRKTPKLETLSRIAAALDVGVLALLPSSITDGAIIPTQEERALLAAVSDLNDTGIKKVCEFAEDISTNPKYRK